MSIANKALFWSLFAAGGTVAALVFPAVMALFLLVSAGYVPDNLAFAPARVLVSSWPFKALVFGILVLSLWHATHRLRVLVHDFGLRADRLAALVLYGLASIGSMQAGVLLLTIG